MEPPEQRPIRADRALPSLEQRRRLVAVAAGRAPADVRLRGAAVLDPFTGTVRPADVLICESWIAAVVSPGDVSPGEMPLGDVPSGDVPSGDVPPGGVPPGGVPMGDVPPGGAAQRPPPLQDVTLDGGLLSPGLIDGHMHLESSLVTPARYAEAVVPRGVTGVVCDPHEVANVAGVVGVRWLLARAAGLPFDVFATVPSCVPSTELETPGARLDLGEIDALLSAPGVVGLAELMSFPALIAGEPRSHAKARAAELLGGTVEGHAPGLRGADLQAYASAGVVSDHEATTFEEGLEKLRAGLFLFVREGSVAKDAAALAPLLNEARGGRIGFCTDDQLPHDLMRLGGVDHALRTAVGAGADVTQALISATWSVARHYRLPRRGAVAPGYLADLTWWRGDPAELVAGRVWKEGAEVARDGRMAASVVSLAAGATSPGTPPGDAALLDSVRVGRGLEGQLAAALRWRDDVPMSLPVPVVGVVAASLLTEARSEVPRVVDGALTADPERDLALLSCTERHGHVERSAAALVHGFGLLRGALACSVGHDHHNLMAVGAEPGSIATALRRVASLGGGMVAALGGEVLAELALPLGGLLTDAPLSEVVADLDRLNDAATSLGVTLPSPLMALSFLGLAVIPELKLTDHGLVDVTAGRVVALPWGPARPA